MLYSWLVSWQTFLQTFFFNIVHAINCICTGHKWSIGQLVRLPVAGAEANVSEDFWFHIASQLDITPDQIKDLVSSVH